MEMSSSLQPGSESQRNDLIWLEFPEGAHLTVLMPLDVRKSLT